MEHHLGALKAVEQSSPRSLRLVSEEVTPPPSVELASLPGWRRLCRCYLEVTGCLLRFIPGAQPSSPDDIPVLPPQSAPAAGSSPNRRPMGYLRVDATDRVGGRVEAAHSAREMACSLAEILGEFLATRVALWEREAELAAGIPLIPHPEEDQHLARRLEEALRAAVVALGVQAAAVYILDETTTYLKLRALWGLPRNRFLAEPRPLKQSPADLEAMLGHAVALENARRVEDWKCPESCGAAVCLPISTPTTILGTLWLFSDKERSFSDKDIELLEVTAGRVASELEREAALQAALQATDLRRQWETAQRLVRSQLPAVSPLLDTWEFAGWLEPDRMAGAFYDWCCTKDGCVHFALGEMPDDSLRSSLVLSSVRAAWRSHCQYLKDISKLMGQLNLTLWTGSAGDQAAAFFCGVIDSRRNTVRMTSAGPIHAALITPKRHRILPSGGPLVGLDPESCYTLQRWSVPENSLLVVMTAAVREAKDADRRPLWETQILPMLSSNLHQSAKTLIHRVQELLELRPGPTSNVAGLLLVKRRPVGGRQGQ